MGQRREGFPWAEQGGPLVHLVPTVCGWADPLSPELEVQMVPQRMALAVQLKMKMVKPMQQSTLLLQLASFLGLIPQELQGVLWRLSVLVGLHC